MKKTQPYSKNKLPMNFMNQQGHMFSSYSTDFFQKEKTLQILLLANRSHPR